MDRTGLCRVTGGRLWKTDKRWRQLVARSLVVPLRSSGSRNSQIDRLSVFVCGLGVAVFHQWHWGGHVSSVALGWQSVSSVALMWPYVFQTNLHLSREMQSLKSQLEEMKNMMRLSFDLQMDIQRAIRQEVAAALATATG